MLGTPHSWGRPGRSSFWFPAGLALGPESEPAGRCSLALALTSEEEEGSRSGELVSN